MKQYHIRGLLFVAICVVIGLILAIASHLNFTGSRATAAAEPRRTVVAAPSPEMPRQVPPSDMSGLSDPPSDTTTLTYSGEGDTPVQEPPTIASNAASERATRFAYTYFAAASGEPEEELDFVGTSFAPMVRHYGAMRSREDLLREHSQFVSRWPQRSYRVKPEHLSVSCDETGSTCTVSGIVDFFCSSPERGATSRGSSSFVLRLSMDGGAIAITSDDGHVISRG